MRKLFPGSYAHQDEDFKLMWSEGMFVFDANMILNFHRYSEETRKEFLALVASPEVAPRVWIPHQVAAEYHKNLDEVRYEQIHKCADIRKSIKEWGQSSRAGDHKKRAAQLLALADQFVAEAEQHYQHADGQALITQIARLFDGKVGPEWSAAQLSAVYKDGATRYKNKVPPGFKDKPKQDDDQFGDLVVWEQVIEEASKRKKPVIFVTDDNKEDWWLKIGGKTIGPLPALRNEIHRRAGVQFHMYQGDRFLVQARSSLKSPVREETVAEVKQVREEHAGEERKEHYAVRRHKARMDIAHGEARLDALKSRAQELKDAYVHRLSAYALIPADSPVRSQFDDELSVFRKDIDRTAAMILVETERLQALLAEQTR